MHALLAPVLTLALVAGQYGQVRVIPGMEHPAFGCLDKPSTSRIAAFFTLGTLGEGLDPRDAKAREMREAKEAARHALEFAVEYRVCEVFRKDAAVTLLGQDQRRPEWILVRGPDSPRGMWTRAEWFQPAG